TYTAKTPYIDARCTISNNVKLMMTKRLSKVISEKDIAEDLCVSPSTVHRHLKSLNESIQTTVNRSLPR
ncbi:helix-turn-helix transcriptional regulator, partial [Staphylococcus canis]